MKIKLFPTSVMTRLKEMSNSVAPTLGLRNSLSALRSGFYEAPTSPLLRDTKIEKDKARALYYNINPQSNFGAFLAKPIIDSTADYIGIPRLSIQDPDTDLVLNNWVKKYWKKPLWEMYKNSLREADTWVRIRKPFPSVLLSNVEEDVIELEVIDSDRVTPYYHPTTNQLIRVEILTTVYIEDEPFDPYKIYAVGLHTHGRMHEIVEIITPQNYMYYDATTASYLDNYTTNNDWGFVPLVQVFNDYDSALNGGLSELETVYPFLVALHDLIVQTRTAYKYTANPKVKFKLKDVNSFLMNNFPDSFVEGKFTGRISWKNSDVFFMEDEEDADFIVADMGISEASTFMEFLIDCICMASETPEAMLFRAKTESATENNEYERFKIKITRKRDGYEEYVRQIVKMALKISGRDPMSPTITWSPVQAQDMVTEATALSQTVTAAEVANRAKVISRETYRAKIREFFPDMKEDSAEDKLIQGNVQEDNKQELDQATAMAKINTPPNNSNGGGPNSASSRASRARAALPMDVVPTQPGE